MEERQRFQNIGNLERMLVITAFLVVRLLQLRELLDTTETTSEKVLTEDVESPAAFDRTQ